jgi:hypothetical protein
MADDVGDLIVAHTSHGARFVIEAETGERTPGSESVLSRCWARVKGGEELYGHLIVPTSKSDPRRAMQTRRMTDEPE